MKPPVPLHDQRFVWIPSRDHDAGSDAFRARQRERMKAAQAKTNVQPIKPKQKAVGDK